jgi:preprotein translocase subunit YajC
VGSLGAFLPFVLIALVFYLLILRPQRRRQQTMQATQKALRAGTEVMLGSGIYGTVAAADDEETSILVEVAPGTVLKVARQAVVRIIEPAADDAPVDDTPAIDAPEPSPEDPDSGSDDRPGPDQRP